MKVTKKTKLIIISILLIIFTGTSVYAAATINSSDVSYSGSDSELSSTTVKDALDEIVSNSKTNCPEGATCYDDTTCTGDSCKKCVRAKVLHTETCSVSSGGCIDDGYTNGSTIIYGSNSVNNTLTTGDAFDCDVNGDGIYNSKTERFYYVTDMDSSTAVLVYYNNVSAGEPSNTTLYAYDDSGVNNNGPVTAIKQLPTTTQWNGVSLTNTTRTITNEIGGTTTGAGNLPTAFSYEGYAARLLTYQEIYAGCYDGTTSITGSGGLSNKCKFLYENTIYSNSFLTFGYWLETPSSSSSDGTWFVYGDLRLVSRNSVAIDYYFGVRPAIEVLKTDIDY